MSPSSTDIFREGIWTETQASHDPFVRNLTTRLQKSVLLAKAPSTTDMYFRAFKKWRDFAAGKLKISSLPANYIHVALYLQHVLDATRSCSSVDTAFYAIKWAHEMAGLVFQSSSPIVSKVRAAAKRIGGTTRPNRKEPLPVEVLKEIVEGADLSNILQLRNVCLYVLSYAGFFRSDEVRNIRRNDISFHDGYMTIRVEKSKTDQLRQGDEVVIAQSGSSVCPVSLLKDYLSMSNISPHSNEFSFRPLVKTKSSHRLIQHDKPISYTTFRDHLAKNLKSVVPDPSSYGTHSFRSGGATRAANSGIRDRVFQRHGRWKSVAAKYRYVKDNVTARLQVSKTLGL